MYALRRMRTAGDVGRRGAAIVEPPRLGQGLRSRGKRVADRASASQGELFRYFMIRPVEPGQGASSSNLVFMMIESGFTAIEHGTTRSCPSAVTLKV